MDYLPGVESIINGRDNKSVKFALIVAHLKGCPRDQKRKILFAAGEVLGGKRCDPKRKGESHYWEFTERNGRVSHAKERSK